jgi:sulfur carrier protein
MSADIIPSAESAAVPDDVVITVNGEPMTVPAAICVTELLERLGIGRRPVAVEINRQIVPRRRLGEHQLSAGDSLEIVTLVGGG